MMLRPILEARPSEVRVRGMLGEPVTHFGQRAAERGISSIPGDALRCAIEWAVREDRDDLVERMFAVQGSDGTTLEVYRFLAPEGPFYALVNLLGSPVTLYDRACLQTLRRRRRNARRRR